MVHIIEVSVFLLAKLYDKNSIKGMPIDGGFYFTIGYNKQVK